MKRLHAHLQYICNLPAKCQKDKLKALQGFAFTNYAIPVNFNRNIPCKNYKVAKTLALHTLLPLFSYQISIKKINKNVKESANMKK